MQFFTSDTHFNHKKILEYCNRPFKDVDEMNGRMIALWNSKVMPDDEVYHLGDFAFGSRTEAKAIRERLNGKIHLILGNHDDETDFGFEWMKPYYELKVGEQTIILFHYGMRTWWHDLKGTWHLYGHSHGLLPPYGKSIDVGVDAQHFVPLNMRELEMIMGNKQVGKHPMWENYQAEQEVAK